MESHSFATTSVTLPWNRNSLEWLSLQSRNKTEQICCGFATVQYHLPGIQFHVKYSPFISQSQCKFFSYLDDSSLSIIYYFSDTGCTITIITALLLLMKFPWCILDERKAHLMMCFFVCSLNTLWHVQFVQNLRKKKWKF